MKLRVPSVLIRKMRQNLRAAGRREIGGMLMAEQVAPGDFRLADFTLDGATGSRTHFVRSPELHNAALEAFFEKTGNNYKQFNYLGEWHSHPSFSVHPSLNDCASMEALVQGERGIEFALLLVVRLRFWGRFECTATVFRRGLRPVEAEIMAE